METEVSLRRPQEPATCVYPEPDQTSTWAPSSYFLKISFNITLSSTRGSSKWSLYLSFSH